MRACLVALMLLVPSVALAQAPAASTRVLPPTTIVGHLPTPVTLFVPRARVRFDRRDASAHAIDRIVESVRHEPF